MKFKNLLILCMLLCASFAYSSSIPSQFHDKSYEVWSGDYDGDGKDDLYLKAKRYTNTIKFRKINTPIPLYKHSSYLLSGYKSEPKPTKLKLWPHGATARGARQLSYKLIIGDFNGDGLLDILFQAPNASYPTFTLYQSQKTSSSQSIKHFPRVIEYLKGHGQGSEPVDVSQQGAEITVVNVNGDRYDDLRIELSGRREIIAQNVQGNFFINSFNAYAEGPTVPGAVAGSSSVSELDGSFSYNMPINVPPGPSGITPNLGIAYNSRAQSNYMGIGYQITGLPVIANCNVPREKEDNRGVEVNFDQQLCLDNTPLVKRRNNSLYPENNPGLAIKPYGDGFKSESIKYEHRYYGNTANARVKTPGRKYGIWRLNRVEDPFGNGYNISYLDQTPENLVKQISYNNVRIDFSYVDHPFPSNYVFHGKNYGASKLLKRIEVTVGGRLHTSYTLGYELAQGISTLLLNKVIQCGADNQCLPATTFKYAKRKRIAFGFDEKSISTGGICADKPNDYKCKNPNVAGREKGFFYDGTGGESSIQYRDANGDGFLDICYVSDRGARCQLNNGKGQFQVNKYRQGYSCRSHSRDCNNRANFTFLDFNRDGEMDVSYMGQRDSDGVVIVSGFDYPGHYTGVCSKDGSCRNERFNQKSVQYPDVNGDNIPDICFLADIGKGVSCLVSQGLIKDDRIQEVPIYSNETLALVTTTKISELQAMPLKGVTNYGLERYSGDGYCQRGHADNWGGCRPEYIQYHDFDKDGMDDLFILGARGIKIFRSTGINPTSSEAPLFEPYLFSDLCRYYESDCTKPENNKTIQFVDFNNDGWLDVCYVKQPESSYRWANVSCNSLVDVTDPSIKIHGVEFFDVFDKDEKVEAMRWADLDNDGDLDLFITSNKAREKFVLLEKGDTVREGRTNFCKKDGKNLCEAKHTHSYRFIDFNQDGAIDLLYRSKKGVRIRYGKAKDSYRLNLLTQIDNGSGLKTTIRYGLVAQERSCNSIL